MKVIAEKGSVPIKLWIDGVPVEDDAIAQLRRTAALPFVVGVAGMPDIHVGKGACVGSVVVTKSVLIPSTCGVDLGCGMMAAKLNIRAEHLPDSLGHVRSAIEKAVPHGRTDNGGRNDRGAWGTIPGYFSTEAAELSAEFEYIVEKYPSIAKGNLWNHLATLGTGNHFIELCVDTDGGVWLMLHTGSRGVGNRIGSFFIEKAKQEMERFYIHLPDKDLAYLPEGSQYFDDYCLAVAWAQKFATKSRELMMVNAVSALKDSLARPDLQIVDEAVNCHHNYISKERHYGENVWVTRKGAVSARKDQLGIIPGSMGAKSFIVRGKGNQESFSSCSHGAGRRMSRTEAKKRFTVEDQIAATAGVECRHDADVVDETPQAYKDIDAVMAAQADLVEVVATLKQVLCVKG